MLAKGSYSWIGAAILFTLISGYISMMSGGFLSRLFRFFFILGFLLTIFFFIFFRDPERKPQGGEDDAVSPADGKVITLDGRCICIFMNIYDVHVNRAPLAGRITVIDYKPGGFIPAFFKDSDINERNHVVIETEYGTVELFQIAGILTRRIVSYISEGGHVKRGERIGMIRFGSRVDVHIPETYEFTVKLNATVKAGETVIAMRKEKIRR
ncbi:MAG: phosphatidylserine decarboxylase [Candidatus Methanoperedens sp.]|nr:phosphatidylserine decarboxylase [Candidatus Methanoperedens sp.]MCZ7358602.1 phosphatidylserine decarboxylase [Candidatus Methanoperedens sp.]HLB70195.1 phosphatidylserine decarboxylase [Candidatus Methanoperedens sp.]